MARFDQGLTYDSGNRYDAASPPVPAPPQKHMAKPKLELKKRTDYDLITFAQGVVTAMTGNPNFPTPMPALAVITGDITTMQARINTITELENQLRAAYTDKDGTRDTMEQNLTYLANYVEIIAAGSASVIESAGMPVRNLPTPVGEPGVPENLNAAITNHSGAVDLEWAAVPGAATYEIHCKLHNTTDPFQPAKTSTAARVRVDGLTPGVLYAFRVRAIGSAGPGAWSDEVVKRAP